MKYDIDPKTLKKASPRVSITEIPEEFREPQVRYKSKAKEQLAMLSNTSQSQNNSNTRSSQEGDWNLRPLSIQELEELE